MGTLGKENENRLQVTRKVAAAARTHGPALAPVIAGRLQELNGPGAPDATAVGAVLAALAGAVEGAGNGLQEAALGLVAEQADDHTPRRAREEAAAAVLGLMVRLRSTIEDTFGVEGVRTYGLEGETPRAPKALASHTTRVIHLLKQRPASVATALGTTVDTAAIVAALEAKNAPLVAALADMDREERELEQAIGRRDQALGRWSEVYQGVANALEGLFQLAGRSDLADRVRPTSRTVSGEDAGPAEEPAPAPPAPPASPASGEGGAN